jgi:pimeloyl-ACP methyl ester carboxylesterase
MFSSSAFAPMSPRLVPLRPAAIERIGFLTHGAHRLYYVQHVARGIRRGKVLLVGPFGLERQVAYTTWLRWARALSAEGFEVLRFDFRGTGESTGDFHEACLSDWLDDARASFGFLRGNDSTPLLLSGLRMGALIAAELFAAGLGEALLAWGPPPSGRVTLEEVLRRKLYTDVLENVRAQHKSKDAYVADLESGSSVEVEGYLWSSRLWTDSARHVLPVPPPEERRPWTFVRFDPLAPPTTLSPEHEMLVQVLRPPFWWHNPSVVPDLSTLFRAGLEFAAKAVDEARFPR